MKQLYRYVLLIFSIFMFLSSSVHAQIDRLIGLSNNATTVTIYEIDEATGQATTLRTVPNPGIDLNLELTYIPEEAMVYGTARTANNTMLLYSFSICDFEIQTVNLTYAAGSYMAGLPVRIAEGIAFNSQDERLYIVSGNSTCCTSDHLGTVDPLTGVITPIGQVSGTIADTDNLSYIRKQLVIAESPGNINALYESLDATTGQPLPHVNGVIRGPIQFYNASFQEAPDGTVYVSTSIDGSYGAAGRALAVLNIDATGLVTGFNMVGSYGLPVGVSIPNIVFVHRGVSAEFAIDQEFCPGDDQVVLTPVQEGGAFTVNGIPATVFNPSKPGTYDITYSIISDAGCTETSTRTVTVHPTVTAEFALDEEYCAGDYDVALVPVQAGGTFTVNGVPATVFVPSKPGTYDITYSITSGGMCTETLTRTVTVKECCQYKIGEVSGVCGDLNTNLCVPLTATYPVSRGIIGMDYCLEYDPAVMRPLGNYTLGNVVTHGNSSNASAYVNTNEPGKVRVSINYNSSAPQGMQFNGSGEVICLNFRLVNGAQGNTTHTLTSCELEEAYKLGEKAACWESGLVTVEYDNMFRGRLIYQGGLNNPMGMNYVVTDPNMAVTEITGTNSKCENVTSAVNPDANGRFAVDISGSDQIKIVRDIKPNLPTTYARLRHINGLDTYVMRHITTMKNTGFFGQTPTPYQMIAADVNISGKVRANDITHVQERIVRKTDEYPQVWNEGTNQSSLDWRFIDRNTVLTDPAFAPSSTYPADDAIGYYRDRVPAVPFCLPYDVQCKNEEEQIYSGILLGDVYASYISEAYMKVASVQSTAAVTFDVDDVTEISENVYRVYVRHNFVSENPLVSFDFVIDYDENVVSLVDVQQTAEATTAGAQVDWNDFGNNELILTSYTDDHYLSDGNLFYVDLQKESGIPIAADLTAYALLNGQEVISEIEFQSEVVTGATPMLAEHINIMPNPASDNAMITFNAISAEKINVQVLNSLGQVVRTFKDVSAQKALSVNLTDMEDGIYYCMILIDGRSVVKKLVVSK